MTPLGCDTAANQGRQFGILVGTGRMRCSDEGRIRWELTGRRQIGAPDLLASQRERVIRDRAGAEVYQRAYAEGRAMPYEEAMAYATDGTDGWAARLLTD
ncbi:hypothetical protein HLK59_26550 [Streptomyces sp. S3(2020)]|uniref:hypothetical protein n=1 Tax=Streptomyces sp. S3(2020) TaxID=2732044 RepID=UPI0014884D97|nr:hypothetical protein [Streptomyces sp. S3(2020)]NNN33862.1 hypothetical protein [Streptomyces sp. S3(2020)]